MEQQRQENKMGTMPEGRLLMNMSLPMMVSMLVHAMYNIVDSIFVSRISENALTAVSLAFPMQTLLIAVAAGTGVGVNSLLSKSLGEKNYDRANKTAMNGIFLYIISYIVSAIVGIVAVHPFYASQIKNAPVEIMDMGVQYLTIVMVASFGLYAQFIFETDCVYDDLADGRGDHQYYSRSDPDLWLFRAPEDGCSRSSDRDGYRTDHRRMYRTHL